MHPAVGCRGRFQTWRKIALPAPAPPGAGSNRAPPPGRRADRPAAAPRARSRAAAGPAGCSPDPQGRQTSRPPARSAPTRTAATGRPGVRRSARLLLPCFRELGRGQGVAERDRAARAACPLTPARLAPPQSERRLDEAAASSSASQADLPFLAKTRTQGRAAARAPRRHRRDADAPLPPAAARRAGPRSPATGQFRCICDAHGLCMAGACDPRAPAPPRSGAAPPA